VSARRSCWLNFLGIFHAFTCARRSWIKSILTRPSLRARRIAPVAADLTAPQTLDLLSTVWEGQWIVPAAQADPVETYALKCVAPGASCNATVAASVGGLTRANSSATISNLTPLTSYDCYLVATNVVGSACSPKFAIKTLIT
jgi:hypothetical protein